MRIQAKVPSWMIADGEYVDVAVGRDREFGFALVPVSMEPGSGERVWRQQGTVVSASGIVMDRDHDVPPVLDEGELFPIILTAEPVAAAGTALAIEGRLLVEPYLWAGPGLLPATVPEGFGSWTVEGVGVVRDGVREAIDALPDAVSVDHDSTYVLHLARHDRRAPMVRR